MHEILLKLFTILGADNYNMLILAVFSMFLIIILAITFWSISLLLPSPETGKKENLRNFVCAYPPSFITKEFKCEIFYPFLSVLVAKPLMIYAIYALYFFKIDALPFQVLDAYVQDLPLIAQVLLALLVLDIALWIRHSFVHKYCWSYHAVHHCAREVSWLTTYRLHPLDEITMGVIDFAVLYVIGFSAEGMAVAMIIKDINNFWVHSNIVLDYPKPLKYLFVSPNMHRWHHATEKEAHDKNYCVVFAFVDYLLGSFYVPDNRLPTNYGCGNEELDDIQNKNIFKELFIPFTMTYRKSQYEKAPAPSETPQERRPND